jgi:hypothetical protein
MKDFETAMLALAEPALAFASAKPLPKRAEPRHSHPYIEAAEGFGNSSGSALDLSAAVAAFKADSDLRPHDGSYLFVAHTSDGSSTSLTSPTFLIESLLTCALMRLFYCGDRDDLNCLRDFILGGCRALRDACASRPIPCFNVIGFAGCLLPDDSRIDTPWGPVRRAFDLIGREPYRIRGRFWPPTSVVLTTEVEVPALFKTGPEPSDLTGPIAEAYERPTRYFPLAVALATKDQDKIPLMVWQHRFIPLYPGGSTSWPTLTPTGRSASELSRADVAAATEWSATMGSLDLERVGIAVKRVVQALSHRGDSEDVLIDSVMVWENLLGTDTEISFRVPAALTKLLETPVDDRLTRLKGLRDIYSLRSKVVHGASVKPRDVEKSAKDALEVAIEALARSLFRGEQWLKLTSTQRSTALLLSE